jgi:tetratricopeptide (TPR) repeat protein
VSTARRFFAWLTAGALAAVGLPLSGRAFSSVAVGDRLENPRLRRLGGGVAELLSRASTVNLFVFVRPEQDRSLEVLKTLSRLQREFAARPVRMVAVVSDTWPEAAVEALVAEAGFTAPVLVDAGDALYGALGVRLHPVVGLADREQRLVAYEHYRRINFGEIVRGRIRVMLGDATAAEMAKVLAPEKATSGSPEAEARRHLNLARMLWTRKNAGKALESVQRSLAVLPSAPGWALQGEIIAAGGDCRAATPLFERALKIDPNLTVAIQGLRGCAMARPATSP